MSFGSRVQQNSILGTLLFTIYTSLLFTAIKSSKVHCYAYDTQLYYSSNSTDIPIYSEQAGH